LRQSGEGECFLAEEPVQTPRTGVSTRKKLKVHGSERRVLKATLGGKTRL
jgi:hypothetical protein